MKILSIIVTVLLLPIALSAIDVTLEWDANVEPNLAGYRIFARIEGNSYDYPNPNWEGTELTCTLQSLQDGVTWYFVARAFNTEGFESGNSNEVMLPPGGNTPPTANAGPDQIVNSSVTVILDGSASSDPDDGINTFHWTQTGGNSVSLVDTNLAQASFTSPDVGPGGETLTFQLTVTDFAGQSSSDSAIVNVTWQNQPPTANAGPDQTVDEKTAVTLDGSGSTDPDDGISSYQWVQTGGTSVSLSNSGAVSPTFTAPAVGSSGDTLTFQLTVTDNGGLSTTDSTTINVSWINDEPPPPPGGLHNTLR